MMYQCIYIPIQNSVLINNCVLLENDNSKQLYTTCNFSSKSIDTQKRSKVRHIFKRF